MRTWFVAVVLLLIGPVTHALAQTEPFHAGIARISVSAGTPFDVLVWYPTQTEETPWQVGPFSIPATHNATVAPGPFPMVLLSHGGGTMGGSPLVLRELSSGLARQGFIVVEPFHGEAALAERLPQMSQALDAVIADPRFNPHADRMRLGMLGFSLGGAVALESAGAVPDMAHFLVYCSTPPHDVMSCDHAPGGGGAVPRQNVAAERPPSVLRLKAVVLLDPFAALFRRQDLAAVTMPVLLFRPDQSELPGGANAIGLKAALPRPPQFETVPGGHFIFVDVCPSFLQAPSPELCRDPPGIDRAAIHRGIEAKIAAFFHHNL